MRLAEFRELMRRQFGRGRAPSVAQDHVFAALDGRSVDQAIEDGLPPKKVWAAVYETFDVPESMRYGLPD